MEPIQSPLLNYVESFGTRNQEQFLGDVVTPTWPVQSDAFVNMQLVGADAVSDLTAAGAVGSAAVNVEQDTYCTGIWMIEPQTNVSDTILVLDAYVQRVGLAGAPVQITPLLFRPFSATSFCGRSSPNRRMYMLEGWPWGSLLRAGDVITIRYENAGAAALILRMIVAYRGFKGPPP